MRSELSNRYNETIDLVNFRGEYLGTAINNTMIVDSDITKLFPDIFNECGVDDAIVLADRFSSLRVKDLYLVELSKHYKKDSIDTIENVAIPKIRNSYDQGLAQKELCLGLTDRGNEGDVKKAEKLARSIQEIMTRESTLSQMSIALFQKGLIKESKDLIEESLDIALRIPSPGYRKSALWCLREDASKDKDFDSKFPGISKRIFDAMCDGRWLPN